MQMRRPIGAVPLFSHPAKPASEYDVTDMRHVDPRWQPDNFEKNVEAVGKLGDLAATNAIPAPAWNSWPPSPQSGCSRPPPTASVSLAPAPNASDASNARSSPPPRTPTCSSWPCDGDRTRLGPRSLSPVSRFVVDHAPCPVLLVWPSLAPGLTTIPPPPPHPPDHR